MKKTALFLGLFVMISSASADLVIPSKFHNKIKDNLTETTDAQGNKVATGTGRVQCTTPAGSETTACKMILQKDAGVKLQDDSGRDLSSVKTK